MPYPVASIQAAVSSRTARAGVPAIPYHEKVLAIQPTKLIQYMRLNDTSGTAAVDSSGNGNNGAYTAVGLANAPGPDGVNCAYFDGVAGTRLTPYSADFASDLGIAREITIGVWMKAEEAALWLDGATHSLMKLRDGDANNVIEIYKTLNNNRITYSYKAGGVASVVHVATTAPLGWVPVMLTASLVSDAVCVFINGIQVGPTLTGVGTFANVIGSYETFFGAASVAGGVWKGWLAHACVWKVALTPAEALDWATISPSINNHISHAFALTAIPAAVNQHGFEECGGLLYAVAGEVAAGGVTNAVYAYDPVAGTWAQKANLPISVQSPVVRSVGGKLYCIGGYNNTLGVFYKDVYEYDPGTDAWTKKTDMPTAREDMGSAVIGTKIYVFGGVAAPTLYKCLEIYDTVANTWATGADMPDYKLLGDFGAALDGYVYAIGATNTMADYPTLHPVTACYRYDPAANEWTSIADIPVSTCYKEVVPLYGKLYAIAGCAVNTTTPTDAIYEYDPTSNSWGKFTAPVSYRGAGLTAYSGAIYMCGGYQGGAMQNSLYRIK
jgi:N-acetylneuraminic acid mutarotase